MNDKPGYFQRIQQFLAGKGFYMVLLLCLVLLGFSGYYLWHTISTLTVDEPVAGQAQVSVNSADTAGSGSTDSVVTKPSAPIAKPEPVVDPVVEPEPEVSEEPIEETIVPVTEPVVEPTAPATPVFSWPVEGAVVAAFSDSELTYNAVLGDWRTHDGIDIAADVGAQVLSAAAGTVDSITRDPRTGITITLCHADGISSVYGNLDADTLCVSEGERVSAGTVLGCVGSGAGDNTRPCLHFSLLENGKAVDPEDWLE